jgi:2-polyprenyl-6-methoxyphenol hydroxylase-like FAD-dependent oxidoreductase
MPPLKALIVGGGIAGPALAHWLSRIGAHVTLIERSPQMRASGQQLDLRSQGVPMMKKMGIENAVRAARVKEPGMQLIDLHGRTKAYFPAAEGGAARQSITSDYEIMRADLVRILYALTENHTNVQHVYDTTVKSFTQDDENDPDGKVHVCFHNGQEEDYDLVVGADGTGSKTRRIMLGPDAPDPRQRRGGYIGYFSMLSQPQDSYRGTMCQLPGPRMGRAIMTRKDCAELTRIYMMTNGDDECVDEALKSGDLSQLKKALADLFEDGVWECRRFMEALRHAPEADDLYCTPFEEVRLPEGSWSKGRVVLIGDAAHSATANGFGTTYGLVGAYVLAGEIATLYEKDRSSPTAAILQGAKNYENIWRPIATAGHGGSQLFDSLASPRSQIGIRVLHTLAALAAYFRLDQKIDFEGASAKWQLPDYPALEKGNDVQVR